VKRPRRTSEEPLAFVSSGPTLTTLDSVIEALRTWEPDATDNAVVESVEAALVDGVDGLTVLWAQGSPEDGYRHFGLVATAADIERLARSNGGIFRLSDLHLMLVEPHAAGQQPRTWFRSTADFEYGG
jgi:hypothetical protein